MTKLTIENVLSGWALNHCMYGLLDDPQNLENREMYMY